MTTTQHTDHTHGTDLGLLGAQSARLYYRYARAVDEGDLDTLRTMCTDDIRITRGTFPTEDGIEAFLDVYRAHNAMGIPVCKHVVTNVLAEPGDDGDIVTHAYFEATMLEEEGTRVVIGVYDDVHREVDGELRLAHKVIRVQRVLHLPVSSGTHVHVGK